MITIIIALSLTAPTGDPITIDRTIRESDCAPERGTVYFGDAVERAWNEALIDAKQSQLAGVLSMVQIDSQSPKWSDLRTQTVRRVTV